MKSNGEQSSSKLDRKTMEKNRRIHMKALCFKLSSLIPSHNLESTKHVLSQQTQVQNAVAYIKQLKERIKKLKERRDHALRTQETKSDDVVEIGTSSSINMPIIELKEWGSCIEVVLINGLNKNMLHQIVSVLEEEGAEVVSASFFTMRGKVLHALHAKVKISRLGVEPSRIRERLRELSCRV